MAIITKGLLFKICSVGNLVFFEHRGLGSSSDTDIRNGFLLAGRIWK